MRFFLISGLFREYLTILLKLSQRPIMLDLLISFNFRCLSSNLFDLCLCIGKNLIGLCHGNGVKVAELPMLMADDQSEAWGRTVFRHFLYGHIHHKTMKAYTGCTTESFKSIASRDSWHHGSGYRADRGMERIDYHIDGGIDSRKLKNIFYKP